MSEQPIPGAGTNDWKADVLGSGFQSLTLEMGEDPDTKQAVQATLVRANLHSSATHASDKPAILWVHGMSDYFFQRHVAEFFTSHGYPFYALDLRRCGRSRQRGERWHYTRDLRNYFPELTKAARILSATHAGYVPLAHSTGGLIVPLWADALKTQDPALHQAMRGIILNSPWLDLQYPAVLRKLATPILDTIGRALPLLPLPGGNLNAYGESIHTSAHGQWHFNTQWKPFAGHKKYCGWIRAILRAQQEIHAGNIDAATPVLTLHSAHSYLRSDYSPAVDTADAVLDVAQIAHWAPTLSSHTQVIAIPGARHDVFLSEQYAREAALKESLDWLERLG